MSAGENVPSTIIGLDEAWIYKLSVLSRLVSDRVSLALQSVEDINLSQWRVLAAVADTPGRSASEVASVTPMDKGLVSRAVSALVSRGYLDRVDRREDRRASSLYLTAQGARIYERIVENLAETDADGTRGLSTRLKGTLLDTLQQAIDGYLKS